MREHSHYFFPIPEGITEADVYRLIEIIGITCPTAQHVFKKCCATGKRGHKDLRQDWKDILDTAKRKLEMLDEDERSAELAAKRAAKDKPIIRELYTDADQAKARAMIAAAWEEGEKRMEQIGPNGPTGEHYIDPHG